MRGLGARVIRSRWVTFALAAGASFAVLSMTSGFSLASPAMWSGAPWSFSADKPRIGDHGVYETVRLVRDANHSLVVGERYGRFEFTWLEPADVLDHNGTLRRVNRVATEEDHVSLARSIRYEAAVRSIFEFDAVESTFVGLTSVHPPSRTTFLAPPQMGVMSPLCLLENELQSETVSMRRPVHFMRPGGCRLPLSPHNAMFMIGGEWIAIGQEVIQNRTTTHLVTAHSIPAGAHAWVAQGVPYPIQIVHGVEASEDLIMARLLALERGQQPIARNSLSDPVHHAFEMVAWTPLGVDDSSRAHPFRYVDAMRRMTQDPGSGMSRVLASPGGHVASAKYAEAQDETRFERWWSVLASGNGQWVQATLVQVELLPETGPLGRTPLSGGDRTLYEYRNQSLPASFLAKMESRPPPSVPSIGALARAWDTHLGEGPAATGWEFSFVLGIPYYSLWHSTPGYLGQAQGPSPQTPTRLTLYGADANRSVSKSWASDDEHEFRAFPLPRTAGWIESEPQLRLDGASGSGAVYFVLSILVGAVAGLAPFLRVAVVVAFLGRLKPRHVLDHPMARRISAEIRSRPGIRFEELAASLGIKPRVLERHLSLLVASDEVHCTDDGTTRRYVAAVREPVGTNAPGPLGATG